MPGLTSTGFEIPTLPEIVEALNASVRAELGATLDLNPETSVGGKIIGVVAERFAELWEGELELFSALNPNTAQGAGLDSICAITGTVRRAASFSTVPVVLVGTTGITIPAGSRVAVQGNQGAQFELDADAELVAVAAWEASTAYAVGALARNGGNVYRATTAGTSAGAGGPSGEGSAIVDGTVTWRFCGTGTGALSASFSALDSGPVQALAFALTEIQTPVANWDAAINFFDAEIGAALETDSELRQRREIELFSAGSGTVDAIRAAVLAVDGVTTCSVGENVSDVTDGESRPPHSFEAIVEGGDDQEIAEAIFATKPAGIRSFGTENVLVTDDQGVAHDVEFTRPTPIPIFVIVNVTKNTSFPADGAAQIKAAIAARGALLAIGNDVVSSNLKVAPFSVAGVIDVTALFIDDAPAPATETTVTIGTKQRATFNTANITVNLSNGAL